MGCIKTRCGELDIMIPKDEIRVICFRQFSLLHLTCYQLPATSLKRPLGNTTCPVCLNDHPQRAGVPSLQLCARCQEPAETLLLRVQNSFNFCGNDNLILRSTFESFQR